MPLTTDFRESIQADMRRNPEFRRGMLSEALESLLSGEVALAKEILRDYINATVGFSEAGGGHQYPRKDDSSDVRSEREPDRKPPV